MQKVFTNQNIAIVGAVRSYLETNGTSTWLRNEFSSSVVGEVAFDVWPEIWVHDEQYPQALTLVKDIQSKNISGPDWLCAECREPNPVNFELCWQCVSIR